jgi:hypothetical protein
LVKVLAAQAARLAFAIAVNTREQAVLAVVEQSEILPANREIMAAVQGVHFWAFLETPEVPLPLFVSFGPVICVHSRQPARAIFNQWQS